MLSRPQTTLLAVLALSSVAQASWFDDGIHDILRRQNNPEISPSVSTPSATPSISESTTSSPTPSPTPAPAETPSETPSPTPTEETSSTPTPSTTSSVAPPTTTPPSPTPESPTSQTSSTSPAPKVSKTTSSGSVGREKFTPIVIQSPTVIRITRTAIVDGSVMTTVSETTSSVPVTATNLAINGSESSGGSMSPKTKSTIIGVVVGIGGAILLGGLAIVAWRIWGRKETVDDRDELMDYSGLETSHEKTGSANSSPSTPFQSTLESYHNPSARVNASSNF